MEIQVDLHWLCLEKCIYLRWLALDLSGSVVSKSKSTWTATLGLVVHAAADGIALGNQNKTHSVHLFCLLYFEFIQ